MCYFKKVMSINSIITEGGEITVATLAEKQLKIDTEVYIRR